MKTLTVDQIMDLDPGYTREQVEALFGNRTEATLLEILDAPIPAEDRVWALTQPDVLTPEQGRRFCDLTADRAVRNHCLHCGVPAVETWAARWLAAEDRSEAARDARSAAAAAWSAWGPAAWSAWGPARAAARAAARFAAYAAAAAAADAAAYAAAYAARAAAAATAAAMSAEREAQVRDLRAILEG